MNLLSLLRTRLALLEALRGRGFYVRMHAYEYLIGDGAKLVALLLLEPWVSKGELIRLRGASEAVVKEIVSSVKEVDPGLRLVVREVA